MITIEEYYEDFLNRIQHGADSYETFQQSQFLEYAISFLTDDGILGPEYNIIEYLSADTSMKVDCYDYDENRNILNLIIADFECTREPASLNKIDISSNFKKIEKFFKKSLKKEFYTSLEESGGGYEIAKFIFNESGKFSEINIILLTNKVLKTKLKKLDSELIEGFHFHYDIWDIERFFKSESSKGETESIEIDFEKDYQTSIPALKANFDNSEYSSYLCVVAGSILARLYESYGSRLLEANIRSFLQFKSGINKGIRKTIREVPEMFFAYNNGITATADGVELDLSGNIIKLKNLQIVNGGQTTASLYTSMKNDKSDLSKIFVQMKLSVIPEEQIHDIVPNISRFANSQNKVSDSDLFANHQFHRRMEEKSRRLYSPKRRGELHQTKWYYERARGQYLEEQSKLSDAKRREFKELYPKQQLITKTDLAKILVLFDLHPYKAVQGAQIVFKFFADNIVKKWDESEAEFSDVFYQYSIAKIIIYKTIQNIVNTKKYEIRGQDRAIVVAYATSALCYLIGKQKLSIDYELVWKQQDLEANFLDQIKKTIFYINSHMLKVSENKGVTVLSYSKTLNCWQDLQKVLDTENKFLNQSFLDILIDFSDLKSQIKESKKNQSVISEVDMQNKLYQITKSKYIEIKKYAIENKLLNQYEVMLIDTMVSKWLEGKGIPNKKQLSELNNLIVKIKDDGFDIEY